MSAVLLVDDSPSDRALVRTILLRAGIEVHEAAYGRDVLARALEVRPHAVVLDVNLPDTDGHSVCRSLKADPRVGGVPVLMLTVRDHEADIIAGLEAGADDYVAKDSAPEIILARVRRLVSYRQMATTAVLNEQLVQIGRLLAGIVHEIRAPLSVIRGNAELMRMSLGVDHDSNRWIDPIVRNSQILQVRLEYLMAAVRGGGPAALQPLDVEELVTEATSLFLKGTDPRGTKLAIDTAFASGLPPIRADAGRIIQVLLNLLANAHEATAAAGRQARIRVGVDHVRGEDGAWVEIVVADDGPGIPETVLGRIFEPFFTTKSAGSGYGLYLASEIIREHGGCIRARNGDSGGAQFTIRLIPEPPSTAT